MYFQHSTKEKPPLGFKQTHWYARYHVFSPSVMFQRTDPRTEVIRETAGHLSHDPPQTVSMTPVLSSPIAFQ